MEKGNSRKGGVKEVKKNSGGNIVPTGQPIKHDQL
jgi:hypothetical protein